MVGISGRVLVIAGSDSSAGAGIEGDLKTISALGGYGCAAVTAITAQNTRGVHAVHETPASLVRAQVEAVLDDIGADAVKTGMLGSAAIAGAVADVFERRSLTLPMILDPVTLAKDGTHLLSEEALEIMKARLIPRAALVTPNAPEASLLTGLAVHDRAGQIRAGEKLCAMGARAALVKGGHIDEVRACDALVSDAGVRIFESERIPGRPAHGTGCALASAIAVSLAQGAALEDAIERARAFVRGAILHRLKYGAGNALLDHHWAQR